MPVSSRFLIDYPLGTEAPDIDGDILKVVNAVESLAAQFGQGTLASRPISTPGSPGKQGRFYIVNSGAELGQVHYDYGTGWIWINNIPSIGADSITSTELAANSVGSSELAADSVGDSELADNVVSAAHLVNALKPSTGAGAGTEALRAIGSGAGQVVSGSDARLSDQRTPLDNSVNAAKIVDGSVGAAEIQDGSVGLAELGAQAVNQSRMNMFDSYNFQTWLYHQSMLVQRHPFGGARHVESGHYVNINTTNNTGFPTYITFINPFAGTPAVVNGIYYSAQGISSAWENCNTLVNDLSGSGFTSWIFGGSVGSWDAGITWIADGPD